MFAPLTDHLEIVAGDDYKAEDGRALSWTSQLFPVDLSSATLTLLIGHSEQNLYGNLSTSASGTVPSSPSHPTTVNVDVVGSTTLDLPADEYQYQLTATLSDGDRVTIAEGNLTVLSAPSAEPPLAPV